MVPQEIDTCSRATIIDTDKSENQVLHDCA